MKRIFGDAETYWSNEYTLKKMTPIEYILDPRYETIGFAIAENEDEFSFWLPRDKIVDYLKSQTEPYMFISHNALFDSSILSYHYGIHPDLSIDTLGMARAFLMAFLPGGRASLEKVAAFLGIGAKSNFLAQTKGLTADEIEADTDLYVRFVDYARTDVELCRAIYYKLVKHLSPAEHVLMDMVIRTTTQPAFSFDMQQLYLHLAAIQQSKADLMAKVSVQKDILMSNAKFAEALEELGVDPPTKVSPLTGKTTWAFSKTDFDFMELLEHPDPEVQNLVAARIGVKTTLEETRTSRFINIGILTNNSYGESMIPMALRYAGAHTHRLSGDWGLNLQNLPSKKTKALRKALVVPKDHVIVAVDASQIEARLTAWFARQTDLLERFEANADVYSEFATDAFGYPCSRETTLERYCGKICILGLGFGMGPSKLKNSLNIGRLDLGIEHEFTINEAGKFVYFYRGKYQMIASFWDILNDFIPYLADGGNSTPIGPCIVEDQAILLPNGMRLYYNDLHYEEMNNEWWYTYGGRKKKLYGGKLLENLVQAFDRIIVMEAGIRVFRRTGYRFAHNEHDALAYVVHKSEAIPFRNIVVEEFKRRPVWAPDLPLASEGKIGENYGALK